MAFIQQIIIIFTIVIIHQHQSFVDATNIKKLSYDNSPTLPRRIMARKPQNKPQLVIAAYVNFGGLALPMGPVCPVGMQIALDAIQNATSILNKYQLVVDANDDMCDESHGVKLVANLLNSADTTTDNLVPLTVGPTYAENAYTGMMLQHYDFVGLADVSIVKEVYTNRRKYKGFYSVVPSFEMFYEAIPAFIRSQGWSQVTLLTETYSFWTPLEDILHYNLAKQNITLTGTANVLVHTGGFPAAEQFQLAVRDLAEMDPRIVIVSTNFVSIVPCWLYHYGLYGPGYVFVFFGPSFFMPNSLARTENCTDEMLAAVLQSVIFYWYGYPINLNPDTVDVLGMTPHYFDTTLKERIDEPHLRDKWYFWRSHCYSELLAAVLALNATEAKLQRSNDTLLNWVTRSDNFRRNSSYIQSLLMESLEQLHYHGINAYERDNFNSRKSVTGFVQMQLDATKPIRTRHDLTAAFRTVPVASYDSAAEKPTVRFGPGRFIWRTKDGQPPFDSLRIVPLKEPVVGTVASSTLTSVASTTLLAILALFVLNAAKFKSENVAKSLPLFNGAVLAGNALVVCFVLVLPIDGQPDAAGHCSAASFLVVVGFLLSSGSILAKLHIGCVIAIQESALGRKSSSQQPPQLSMHLSTIRTLNVTISRQSDSASSVRPKSCIGHPNQPNQQQQQQQQRHHRRERYRSASALFVTKKRVSSIKPFKVVGDLGKYSRQIFGLLLTCVLLAAALMAIWLGLQAPQTQRIDRQLEPSPTDLSLAYQHYTYACYWRMDNASSISLGILVSLLVCYLLVVLRSLYLSFILRKAKKLEQLNDLQVTRIASYSTVLAVVCGGAVIWFFFAKDAAVLEIAASSLALIIVLVSTSLIIAPKLKRDFYL